MDVIVIPQQKLKLKMTPEMTQAISILQYSSAELIAFVNKEALENPLIDLVEAEPCHHFTESRISPIHDSDYSNPVDNFASVSNTIYDYLREQVSILPITKQERIIVEYIILSLDENGYFKEDFQDAANFLHVSVIEIKKALKVIQRLEPIGIGATSLQECLAIQLAHHCPKEKHIQKIVLEFMQELTLHNWQHISNELGVSVKDVKQAFKVIKTLHPKPAATVDDKAPINFIFPDFYVHAEKDGIQVTVNTTLYPKITTDKKYATLLKTTRDSETLDFLYQKQKRLIWLNRSIAHRQSTLLKVMETIVQMQLDFFRKGPKHLKPLRLNDVADICKVHVSTISRATRDKYVHTPYGLYELKHFFSSVIKMENGEEKSPVVVKHMIISLIESENPASPLSDQQITGYLNEKGMLIARRTIAKYREQLGVPASKQRRSIRHLL